MINIKPRIRLTTWGVGSFTYKCDNGTSTGFGATPLAAYNEWLENHLLSRIVC